MSWHGLDDEQWAHPASHAKKSIYHAITNPVSTGKAAYRMATGWQMKLLTAKQQYNMAHKQAYNHGLLEYVPVPDWDSGGPPALWRYVQREYNPWYKLPRLARHPHPKRGRIGTAAGPMQYELPQYPREHWSELDLQHYSDYQNANLSVLHGGLADEHVIHESLHDMD